MSRDAICTQCHEQETPEVYKFLNHILTVLVGRCHMYTALYIVLRIQWVYIFTYYCHTRPNVLC